MANKYDQLKEWTIHFLKHKDILNKDISFIEENVSGFDLLIKRKAENQYVLIKEKLDSIDNILNLISDKNVMLIVTNSRTNLDNLISNWTKMCKFQKLAIFFVNPNSSTDKKWSIYPYTHNIIVDRPALRRGLESLFEMVQEWK